MNVWDRTIDISSVREIRAKTTAYLGVGAIAKIADIAAELRKRGIDRVLVMCGRGSYRSTGAWDHVEKAFAASRITFALYDKVTPNPTVDSVDEAVALGRSFGAQAVVAIGGGSPIDAGKSAAILLEYTDKNARDLYELKFAPERAVPIVAVNLTHGAGAEVDRFAVVSIPEKEFKPAIAYDCIYPLYAIDDPALMTGLSPDQTRFVSIDAVNHVLEACTSKAASPYTILLAQETVRLVARYLPLALANPKDLRARYFLLYASMIAGICFDNGLLHFTHALEHPLSAMKPELAHGLGLAMIVPAVVREIYPAVSDVLASVLAPIVGPVKGVPEEASDVARKFESWLFSVGVTKKLKDEGFTEEKIARLVHLTRRTPSLDGLLSMAPVASDDAAVARIYRTSLAPLA